MWPADGAWRWVFWESLSPTHREPLQGRWRADNPTTRVRGLQTHRRTSAVESCCGAPSQVTFVKFGRGDYHQGQLCVFLFEQESRTSGCFWITDVKKSFSWWFLKLNCWQKILNQTLTLLILIKLSFSSAAETKRIWDIYEKAWNNFLEFKWVIV